MPNVYDWAVNRFGTEVGFRCSLGQQNFLTTTQHCIKVTRAVTALFVVWTVLWVYFHLNVHVSQNGRKTVLVPPQNAIITGDLNADCSYMNNGERANSTFLNNATFTQLLGEGVDTTLSSTHCAYDRY